MIAIAAPGRRWPLNRAKCDNTNGGGHFRRSGVKSVIGGDQRKCRLEAYGLTSANPAGRHCAPPPYTTLRGRDVLRRLHSGSRFIVGLRDELRPTLTHADENWGEENQRSQFRPGLSYHEEGGDK